MKFKTLTLMLVLLLALGSLPALAQDIATNTVAFNGFGFSFSSALASNVNISQFPGDPTTLEQPGGPEVRHTQFLFYNGSPAPESMLDGVGGIRVYNTADFAGYQQAQQEYQNLQTLIAQRLDLAPYMVANPDVSANELPFLPVFPAAQVIRARAHYSDSPALQGISYVTIFRQDVSPFTANEFLYTFQGVSADGAHYVSAVFRLNSGLFPAEIPQDFDYATFNEQFTNYLTESVATLNNAVPEDFTPALTTLDALVQSFTFAGAPPVTQPAPTQPQITPTPTISDPTMGGLAGVTWTLASYGDPASQQVALPNVPVTITFSETGVSGSAGCNSYSGGFQFDTSALTIGQVVRTLMACDQPIMAQEDAFLEALATASSFQINGNQLQITYNGGVLTFTAA